MENVRSSKAAKLLALMLCFVLLALSLATVFAFSSTAEEANVGRRFTAADADARNTHYVLNPYLVMPRAFEATVFYEGGTDAKSPIISNSKNSDNTNTVQFEITAEGKPAISYNTYVNGVWRYEPFEVDTYVTFNYTLPQNEYVHLAVTNEIAEEKSVYKLYVNGALVDTVTNKPHVHTFDIETIQKKTRAFSLGCDSKYYFSGVIRDIAVYSEALTAEEVQASYKSGADVTHSKIMAYYDFTSSGNTDSFIADETGNGHYAGRFFESRSESVTDYAYSMAVVGDTQSLTIKDVTDNTNYTSYVYEWIAQNKDKKNIQFVMGLGDVTDMNLDGEWQIVADLHNKLEDIDLPYSVIQGNHDTVKQLDAFFADKENFVKNKAVYFEGNSLGNYYMTFTAKDKAGNSTGHKYMVLALECKVSDAVVDWACQAVESHPDHSVIITQHEFVNDRDDYFNYKKPSEGENAPNSPDQIWMKLASQYENVIMILSGHLSIPTIFMKTPSVGVNGNTVYEFLIDPQQFDRECSYETGMVAMFYFSADGKTVKTEYVSAYQSIKAQELDKEAEDILVNPDMCNYTLDYNVRTTPTAVECEYGIIPSEYSNASAYPFVLFKADKTFVGGYFDFGDVINAMVEYDVSADYNVLMRHNAEQYYVSDASPLRGNINIDLGGFILVKCKPGYLISLAVTDNSTVSGDIDKHASFKIANGKIIKNSGAGEALIGIDYGSSTEGLAKSYSATVDFENVTFVHMDVGSKLIFDTKESGYKTTSGDVKVIINSTFTDCIFDYTYESSISPALTLSKGSSDRIVYSVKFVGGEIRSKIGFALSDFVAVNGNTNGRADSVVFAKNSSGEYLVQKLTSGAIAPSSIEVWQTDDGMTYIPCASGTDDKYTVYRFGTYTETKYGNLPESGNNYAIAVFKNGSYIGGYNEFGGSSGALAAAKSVVDGNPAEEKGSTSYILFLADAKASSNFDNLGQTVGNIVIDLNDHTLTQTYKGKSLFITQAKNSNGMDPYSLTVFNGNIVMTNAGLLTFGAYGTGYASATEEYKEFVGKFENVNFSYAKDSTATVFLGRYDGSLATPKKTLYNVDFTDCVFDLTNAASIKTLMNVNDANTATIDDIVKVNVYGGEVITSNNALILEDVHPTNGSSVNYGVSADGEYLHMTVNGTADAPTCKVNGGAFEFVQVAESEGSITYTLESVGLGTKYGVVTNEYLDYTFVAFSEGVCIGASNSFNGKNSSTSIMGIAKATATNKKDVQIIMLKDYQPTASEYYDDLAFIKATVTVDLNGKTFYVHGSNHLFRLTAKNNSVEAVINMINGNMVLSSQPLVKFQTYNDKGNGKTFSMNFKDITFSLKSGSTSTSMFSGYEKASKDYKVTFNMTFEDCVFDVTNATKHITLFEANEAPVVTNTITPFEINYKITGCEIKAKSVDSFTIFGIFNENSSHSQLPAAATGLYTTITLPKSAAAPDPKEVIVLDGKSLGYAKESEATVNDVTYITYALGEMSKYGAIPPKYSSVEKYLFLLFDENGNCLNASDMFMGATSSTSILNYAKEYTSKNNVWNVAEGKFNEPIHTSYILMRDNCDLKANGESYFDNLAQIKGTVVIDLGGFTFTAKPSNSILRGYFKGTQIFPSGVVFRNGNIVTANSPIAAFQVQKEEVSGKFFIFGFEDIKFRVEGGATSFVAGYSGKKDGLGDVQCYTEIYMNNCEIDITKATNSKFLLFDLGDDCTSATVNLDGVKIISQSGIFALSSKSDAASTGTLKCIGSSVTLQLPIGVAAPTDDMYVFVETSRDETTVTYTAKLAKIESIDFEPKTSITLGSELVYNVYVPVSDLLKSYTVNGLTYEDAEVVTLEDGKSYYRVAVAMPASEAAGDIALKVILTIDGKDYTGTFTMSIPKYARAIIEMNSSEAEVTLVKDVLAYIRAAYVYFNAADKDEAIAVIDEVLGDYASEFAKVEGNTNTAEGLKTVIIALGAKPAIRFVIPEGASLDSYTFKAGNSVLDYTTGTYTEGGVDYTYAEVELYAYQLIGEITYTTGTYSGSYHINSYYDFVTTDETYKTDTNLISLVEKLYSYCKSAEAYRASVTNS